VDADPHAAQEDRRAERRRSYRITEAGRLVARAEAHRLAAILSSDATQALLRSPPCSPGAAVVARPSRQATECTIAVTGLTVPSLSSSVTVRIDLL